MTDVQQPGTPKKVTMAGGSREGSAHSRGSAKGSTEKRVPSAVQRWKRQHEQTMMEKLVGLRNEKKEHTKISKEQATNLARRIPTEMLGRDWLNMIEATLETRAYLVDKLMPTLILGVEKLLNEATKRGLANNRNERDPNFNPINHLAQYLMRNNPRYSNFSEASPYVRSMREVSEELKKELFNIEDNRYFTFFSFADVFDKYYAYRLYCNTLGYFIVRNRRVGESLNALYIYKGQSMILFHKMCDMVQEMSKLF